MEEAKTNRQILFKPKDLYETMLKKQYHDGAARYFDDLAKKCHIDQAANQLHVNEYKKLLEQREILQKQIKSTQSGSAWLIVGAIFSAFLALIFLVIGMYHFKEQWYFLLFFLLMIGLMIFLIVLRKKKFSKRVKQGEEELSQLESKIKPAEEQCYRDLASLNNSYDWNMPATIMENVTGIIDLDPYFRIERYEYLRNKFGFSDNSDPNSSILGVLTGNIQGNPFVLEKVLDSEMIRKTYYGSLTITWTTTYRDSKGNLRVVPHSQTLHASTVHPAPNYRTTTVLVYGNEAAPHLHFRRSPSQINSLKDDREKEKFVEKEYKELQKKADKDIKEGKGNGFTPMGNDAFDVFFGGLDRDNEVEFRLLFTPLAQQNMLSLLNNPEPYGDDFYMTKDGMINIIASAHSQTFNYSADPRIFVSYDYTKAKENFVTYCDAFIQNLYFDLAPLLSIPLYQMHKPHEYIYGKEYPSHFPTYEHEVMANNMNPDCFRPRGADSTIPLLLKSTRTNKIGDTDSINIHAYSYHTTKRVDFVSVHGGDGHYHDVPVYWTQYDRVDSDTTMMVRHVGSNRQEMLYSDKGRKIGDIIHNRGKAHYERGLLSFLSDEVFDEKEDEELGSIFSEKNSV